MLFQKVDYRFVSGLFLALLLALLQTTAVRPACAQDSIAVLPFEINAPEEMSHLESDLPALLVDELRDKGLHVLDMDKIQSVIDSRDISVLDLEEARRLTLAAESRYAVYGSLSSVEEYISLDVRLVDGFQEKQTVPFHISKQGLINILPAVEELADKIYEQMRQEDRIASIEVQGTETLDPDVILLHLNMQEGDLFEPEMLNEELNRIYELGYFEDVQLEARETPDGRHVLIIVEEKPRIQNINILGADKVKEKDIRQSLSTTTGSVLNQEIISEDLDKIRELYRGKGYYNATVDYTVSPINQRTANLNIRINEGNKLYIQGIEIKGAESFSQRELRKEMILKKRGFLSWLTGKGVLREELLDRDAAALEAYYANQGFIDARVGQPEVEYEEEGIFLTFYVEEGPRYKAGEVTFAGSLLESEADLLEIISIDELAKEQEYFNQSVMRDDLQDLKNFYTDFGYAFAEADVEMDVDREEHVVNLVYVLSKGKKIYINRVETEGNYRTRDNVILREMRLSDGDLFSGTALRRSNERLEKLDFFETVEIEPVPTTEEDEIDLVVRVREEPTGVLSAGAGYSSYDKVFFTGTIQQRNLFGKGYDLSFRGSFGSRTTSFDLGFWDPYFRDTKLGLGGDLYWLDDEYFTYDKKTRGGRIRFSYPLGEYTTLYWNYRLEQYTIKDIDKDAHRDIRDIEGDNWSSSAYVAATRDTTNRRLNPSRGTVNTLSAEYGGGLLGGDDNFIKYIYKSDFYHPLVGKTIFHWRGQAGYVMENTSQKIPNFELFTLGGINSVRGYSARKIAPRYEDNEVKGGDKHFFTNLEIIFPLNEEVGLMGVTFFDAGKVWDKGEAIDFDLYKSIGAGIRWYSPLGPIRVEYGYGLDKLYGKRENKLEFSLGHIF